VTAAAVVWAFSTFRPLGLVTTLKLLLDDDVLVRMPVVQFLCDCGYRVVEASGAKMLQGAP
jgi:hypothetical protein